MASMEEVQSTSQPTIDPQQFQQFSPNDVSTPFTGMIVSQHQDVSIPSDPSSHMHVQMPQLFQSELPPDSVMSMSMHMSLASLPPSTADISAMDVIPSQSSGSPGLIPDMSSQTTSFTIDPRINGLDGLEGSHQLLSSPSATTASTNPSHASSPAMSGMTSTYSVGSSSLASALDSMAVARSRSGSSASPANLNSSSSDLGFSSGGSGPPTSVHDPGFQFLPPGFENPLHPAGDNSSDVPGGAHLMVLGDMLKNIARTANSGSEACSMGQSTDAREIVSLLKKNVLMVAELVAAMQLGDGSGLSSAQSSPPAVSTVGPNASAVSVVAGMDVGQQPLLNGPSSSGSLDSSAMQDVSELSRKRCASSVAGDRVLKAMKLEPQDDASTLQIPSNPAIAPPLMLTSPGFPFSASMSSMTPSLPAVTTELSSISAPSVSVANSRPPSSGGMTSCLPMSLIPDASQQVTPPMHPALHFSSQQLDHMQSMAPPSDFSSSTSANATSNVLSGSGFNPQIPAGAVWPDGRVTVQRHHQHSLSAGSMLAGMGMTLTGPAPYNAPVFNSPTRSTHAPQPPVPVSIAPAGLVRPSRSTSFSNLHANPFAFTPGAAGDIPPSVYEGFASRPSTSGLHSPRASSPEFDDEYDFGRDSDDDSGDYSPGQYYASAGGGGIGDGMEAKAAMDGAAGASSSNGVARGIGGGQRRMSRTSPSAEGGTSHGNEVPQEYRSEVERIFFEFLRQTCSNLDATDSKGEPIHQTLMAKKMQRLDESPDFRPFKFRIQAFTNAFLEELARQGYPEEKIPMKKIRNFLWNQPYISRFNEEGKKSKSKGNHIWHVDAKKIEGGTWDFRPFQRKLAGTPPGVAYVGLRWAWTPRIWDPQASRANLPVKYSSPSLPSWLSWKDDCLSGVPPPDAQSCDVTAEAQFMQDGKEEVLAHTVHITIAPMANVDSSFTPSSRRPSLVGDGHNPRRIQSDSMVSQPQPPRLLRAQTSLVPPTPVIAPDSQVVQVLTTAAQRVAQEAQSQVVASPNDAGPELQALAKQQHVLTVTAQAFSSKMAGETPEGSVAQSNALTAAAQQVVLQAARQVAADRTVAAASSGTVSLPALAPQVTVKEVSVATQSAVAQAVDIIGPLSSEVDVLMTAKSLLVQQTRSPSNLVLEAIDPSRSHSTGTSPPGPFDVSSGAVYFPPS